MSRRKPKTRCRTAAGYFFMSFGAGILGGAALAILLLELREYIRGIRNKNGAAEAIANLLDDVVGEFNAISREVYASLEQGRKFTSEEIYRIRQNMKARLRHGEGGLDDRGDSEEMDSLYSAINPEG